MYAGCDRIESMDSFSHSDIIKNTAIPSRHFPSDHLAQVATLRFSSQMEQ